MYIQLGEDEALAYLRAVMFEEGQRAEKNRRVEGQN